MIADIRLLGLALLLSSAACSRAIPTQPTLTVVADDRDGFATDPSEPDQPEPDPGDLDTVEPGRTPAKPPTARTPPVVPIIEVVIKDLSDRLGIDASQVEFIASQELDWPDSSLGCPEPGMSYLTVIVPGYKITLRAEGRLYEYHTALEDRFVLCEEGRPADPPN